MIRRHVMKTDRRQVWAVYLGLWALLLLPVLVPCAVLAAVGLVASAVSEKVAEQSKYGAGLVALNVWSLPNPFSTHRWFPGESIRSRSVFEGTATPASGRPRGLLGLPERVTPTSNDGGQDDVGLVTYAGVCKACQGNGCESDRACSWGTRAYTVSHRDFDPLLVVANWDDPVDVAESVAAPLLDTIDRLRVMQELTDEAQELDMGY